ncbi:MAG: hypothetical protein VX733_08010 [Candidatus Latescibacterota bacterium]|nr:hypothetical protein [Candidatus Latescibacterota bacterium]
MTILFTTIMLTVLLTGFFIWDIDRQRCRMGALLQRIEPFSDQSRRLREAHLRRLSFSLFFNSQLMDGVEQEIRLLKEQAGLPSPDPMQRQSMLIHRRISSAEQRLLQVEAALAPPQHLDPISAPPDPGPESSRTESA